MMTLELAGQLPTIQVCLEKCSLFRFIVHADFRDNPEVNKSLKSTWDLLYVPGWVQGLGTPT